MSSAIDAVSTLHARIFLLVQLPTFDPPVPMTPLSECPTPVFDLSALSPSPFLECLEFLDPMDMPKGPETPYLKWTPSLYGATSRMARLRLDGLRMAEALLPPSLFQGRPTRPELLVGFGMTRDHVSFVNGRRIPPDSLIFGGMNAFFLAYWPLAVAPLQSVGAIAIPWSQLPAGWPTGGRLFDVMAIEPERMDRLRTVLREALLMGSHTPHLLESDAIRATVASRVIETVTTSLRSARPIADEPRDTLGDYVDIYLSIVKYVDDNYSKSFSMSDVAADLRISERTIHTVMTRLQGMTLKSYLKLQRLREVRRNLLYGDADFLVKQAAIKHGFMHQGRFAREYFAHFGEPPSATLARRAKL